MSKSNSDITSQKLMKQRFDALIKAGDELRRICFNYSRACSGPVPQAAVDSKIEEWDAAKKPIYD